MTIEQQSKTNKPKDGEQSHTPQQKIIATFISEIDLGHEVCRLKVGTYDIKHIQSLIQFLLLLKDCRKKTGEGEEIRKADNRA